MTGTDRIKKAILYARVSTDGQARTGYSLAQQLDALRTHTKREGYEVIEEVKDPGFSGATLERPGLERVRNLVAGGGVSVVLAQDRDRFTREPAYHYLLRKEFEEHGTKMRALNDQGDDSPEGELTDGILEQLAKYDRAKIARSTRRGKLQRAREGKIIPNGNPHFGFSYNADKTNYVVNEGQMSIVRRIFDEAVRVRGTHAVKKLLDRERIATPKGCRYWTTQYIRTILDEDVYKPHDTEDLAALVAEGLLAQEVFDKLDTEKTYGICWYNRVQYTLDSSGKKRQLTRERPRKEWVAIPVPSSGVPRATVEAARASGEGNRSFSASGRRDWELSGGILVCDECGRRARTNTAISRTKDRYFYYVCGRVQDDGKEACKNNPYHRAKFVEDAVAEYVWSRLLRDPEKLSEHMDAAIESEAQGFSDPERSYRLLYEQIAELDRKKERFQEQHAAGIIGSIDELRDRLAPLEENRAVAQRELDKLRGSKGRIEVLKEHRRVVLEAFDTGISFGHWCMPGRLRCEIYDALGLKVEFFADGSLVVKGAFDANVMRLTRDVDEYARLFSEMEERLKEVPYEPPDWKIQRIDREMEALCSQMNTGTRVP